MLEEEEGGAVRAGGAREKGGPVHVPLRAGDVTVASMEADAGEGEEEA